MKILQWKWTEQCAAGLVLLGMLIVAWLGRGPVNSSTGERAEEGDVGEVPGQIALPAVPTMVRQPGLRVRPQGTIGNGSVNIGPADRLDSSRLDDPVYRVRFERHKRVVQYLNSPGRQTVECRQIERLCQAYGYGVWAVGAAYSLAFEHAANELILEKSEGRFFPEGEEAIRHLNETMLAGRIEDLAHRLGVRWDPQFLVELMQIRPTVFFGQAFLAGNDGDPLLDRLEWGEAPPPGTAWGPGSSAGR